MGCTLTRTVSKLQLFLANTAIFKRATKSSKLLSQLQLSSNALGLARNPYETLRKLSPFSADEQCSTKNASLIERGAS